jgi:hypothetical protein
MIMKRGEALSHPTEARERVKALQGFSFTQKPGNYNNYRAVYGQSDFNHKPLH